MKRGFITPTISSVNKATQDPASLRNKIHKLSSAVNELRHNVIQEDNFLENLQQSNMKNYNTLNQQIQVLKKSFTSLSDILMNEITNMSHNFGIAVNGLQQKMDYFGTQLQSSQDLTQQISDNQNELEQKLQHTLREFQSIVTNIEGHSLNVDERFDSQSKFMKQRLLDMDQQMQKQSQEFILDLKKISEVQKETKTKIMQDMDNFINTQASEIKYLAKKQELLEAKYIQLSEDVSSKSKTENTEKIINKRFTEIEAKVQQQQKDFQQDLQELAEIYKDSSSQIINDFDKAVNTQHNELKYLLKKVELIESKYLQLSDDVQLKLKWREK